jgi:putative hydrolase of HD superfamily
MTMVAASSASAASASSSTSDCDPHSEPSPLPPYDVNRCIKIALVHDLAEATVGDITPHCGVSDATKHDLELEAITGMTSGLALGGGFNAATTTNEPATKATSTPTSAVGAEILELWKEYEAGATPEAKLVKDMDKLEMILQALEYETDGKNEKSLDGFFDSTRNKWRTPIGKAWGEEIEKRRKTKTTPMDH